MNKKIFRLLTLGIMLTIFWFSNQDANVSDTQSGFLRCSYLFFRCG